MSKLSPDLAAEAVSILRNSESAEIARDRLLALLEQGLSGRDSNDSLPLNWITSKDGEGRNKYGSAMTELQEGACPECGGSDTAWHCTQVNNSGVVDGRLRVNDISTIFFLGCNQCSETIQVRTGFDIAAILNAAPSGAV